MNTMFKLSALFVLTSVGLSSALGLTDWDLLSDHPFLRNLVSKMDIFQSYYQPEKIYVQTDKPLYKKNEIVWFSAYVRDAQTLQKAQSKVLHIELLDPKGSVIQTYKLLANQGQAAGEFQLPADAKGGIYKIKAYTNWQQNTQSFFEKTITVQEVVLPNLSMKLDFERESYGAGEEFSAFLDLASLENAALKNFDFQYVVAINGQIAHNGKGKTDGNGRAFIRHTLPKKLLSNDVLLNVILQYKGQAESIARAVPVVLGDIDLQFFAEAGHLVDGQRSKIAFKALNEFGKPADVSGVINDSKGNMVAQFSSYHQGMGTAEFTPIMGEQYTAQIKSPAALSKTYPLPQVEKISSFKVISHEKHKIWLQVVNPLQEELFLVFESRNKILFSQSLTARAAYQTVEIPTKEFPIGIGQITLFNRLQMPVAERLVFVNPNQRLNVALKPNKEKYLPREKVSIDIAVTNEDNEPVEGNFSLAVVDDKLLSFADDKQAHILSSVLLEGDLKGKVEEPNFYFDDERDPKRSKPNIQRAQALDNLLLTQGYRSFDWKKIQSLDLPVFAHAAEEGKIKGRVIDAREQGVMGARVRLKSTRTNIELEQQCNANGEFEFTEIPFYEPMELYPLADETIYNVPGRQMVNSFGNNYIFKCNRWRNVRGTISDTNNRAFSYISVQFDYASKVFTDQNGVFHTRIPENIYHSIIVGLDSGTYKLELFELTPKGEKLLAQTTQRKLPEETTIVTMPSNYGTAISTIMVESGRPMVETTSSRSYNSLSSADISSRATRNISDLKAAKTGVILRDAGENISSMASRAGSDDTYVDGVRMFSAGSFIDEIEIEEIETSNQRGLKSKGNKQGNPVEPFQLSEADQAQRQLETERKRRDSIIQQPPASFISKTSYYFPRQFYSPKYEQQEANPIRNDFRSTIYFNGSIQTDKKGKASVEFYSSDDISQFRITVEGFGKNGTIGRQEQVYFSQQPIALNIKVPTEVLTGDQLKMPLTISNNSNQAQKTKLYFALPEHLKWQQQPLDSLYLEAGESKTIYLEVAVSNQIAEKAFVLVAKTADFADKMVAIVKSRPRGFPINKVLVGRNSQELFEIAMPNLVAGSQSVKINIYPDMSSELMKGTESMLRMPSGCFEQVSSSTFPNILVMQYLRSTNQSNKEIEAAAKEYIKVGYQKLSGYQCKDGGYALYGGAVSDIGLTAYGVFEFVEMSKIISVDNKYIDEPARWLVKNRSSWKDAYRFGNPQNGHVYIVWALAKAGMKKEIDAEIPQLLKYASESKDAYVLGLIAQTLQIIQHSEAEKVVSKLLTLQQENGSFAGAGGNVGYSYGVASLVESSSAAMVAILNSKQKDNSKIQRCAQFIISQKGAYGFGSTQSTVFALMALSEFSKYSRKTSESGEILVKIDDKLIHQIPYAKEQKEIVIPDLSAYFGVETKRLSVEFAKTSQALPFDVEVFYNTSLPASAADCRLHLQTNLLQTQLQSGANARLQVTLKNQTAQAQFMPMVMVGIPAGLSLQPWQLKEMQEKQLFDYYELFDGCLVLHFKEIAASDTRQFNFDLKADIPGQYEAPASSAFLYYTPEFRHWAAPTKVQIL